MPPSFECIEVHQDGSIGSLRLNRPTVLNACNVQLMNEVIAASEWLNEQEQIKVVVVSGSGKAFCTGFDLRTFQTGTREQVRSAVDLGVKMIESVGSLRAVTVAAVHGHCIGGGVVLAAACDFRYAAAGTRFHLPETELGVPLAWGGMTWLVRELGAAAAMEFALLCKTMDAERVHHRFGFLNDVIGVGLLDAHVAEVASTLASRSRLVLDITKKHVVAAKNQLANTAYAFMDAHVFYSAVSDEESVVIRDAYLGKTVGRADSEV